MEAIQEQIIGLLTILITGAISIASVYATIYINKLVKKAKLQAEGIEDENVQAIVNLTLDKTQQLIQTNVIAMEQTLVKEIKESIKDGKITKDELKNVAIEVRENVLKQLGEGSKGILENTLGDVNGYIEAEIEKTLAELKGQI
ncbi:MAG: hypothetical protein RSC24_06570 [Clostridium sp.]